MLGLQRARYKKEVLAIGIKGHFERKCRLSNACPYIMEHAQSCDPMVVEDFGEQSVVESWRLPEQFAPPPPSPWPQGQMLSSSHPSFRLAAAKPFSCGFPVVNLAKASST